MQRVLIRPVCARASVQYQAKRQIYIWRSVEGVSLSVSVSINLIQAPMDSCLKI